MHAVHTTVARKLSGAIAVIVTALLLLQLLPATAFAASVAAAAFTGGASTVSVGGTLYAKDDATVTLSLTTSSDTRCVAVSGAHSARQTSSTAKSSWTFTFTADANPSDGVRTVTAAASPNFNANNCTGQTNSRTASYSIDTTGPAVTAAVSPTPNAAGWNKDNVAVTWTATDAGSGVGSGPTPSSSTESANGSVTRTSTATDRLGNVGNGAVTVRVDKSPPVIDASIKGTSLSKHVTFECADPHSGIASCLADGESTNTKTVTENGIVTGTATDVAGNTKTLEVQVTGIDTTAPTLSGSPTTSPNANGWYAGDVTIDWTASDDVSSIADPADTIISGQGTGLFSTNSVSDEAGNTTQAESSPKVNIDRTAPATGVTGGSNSWVNGNVTLTLTPSDNLSGVDATHYTVDGGAEQSGTSVVLDTDGTHTVTYWSTDNAGNNEVTKSATVKIDKTAPTIAHEFSPSSYTGGWTNGDVVVHFICGDEGGSLVASCTPDQTVDAEGQGHEVLGEVSDHAGNSASDVATVSIDKTRPTIEAEVAPPGTQPDGWYSTDVTVSYECDDALSGIVDDGGCDADVLGEGADQTAAGTATDAAGNTRTAEVTGISVDTTSPLLSGSAPDGWHTDDVTVTWEASDALSGLKDGAPAPTTVRGEGANLSETLQVKDKAGNKTSATVTGIKIDRHAPTTQASAAAVPASGWYTDAVEVTLTGSDNLSGVAKTFYSVNDGDAHEYTGPFSITAGGHHVVSFWSKDVAGNVEEAGAPLTLDVDTQAPQTTAINPIVPAGDWFVTSGIPFAFDAQDDHSGVAATYYVIDDGEPQTYGVPFTADLSNGEHTVRYWSVDLAGNVEDTQSMQINVDTVPPSISGTATPAANAHGWNKTDVDVSFQCEDTHSGLDNLAGCAGDTTVTNEGAGQSVTGDALDKAGNRNSTTVSPINIDKTRPTLAGQVPDANAAGWYNEDVTVAWQSHDGLSGIDPATEPADSVIAGEGYGLGAGPKTVADKAGNVSAPASVGGINIDRTDPEITGGPTTEPNEAGWYNEDVSAEFECTDNLSGVAACPSPLSFTENGADQAQTSDDATDFAGNAAAGLIVDGINIDTTAPATTAGTLCTLVNEWCTGETATVTLIAADQDGLSGIKEIHYSVDGGVEQVVEASTAVATVPLDGAGEARVDFFAVDNASNSETPQAVTLKYDNIAPVVSHTVTPAPNADDWNKDDVTVRFSATDSHSLVDDSRTTGDVTVTEETSGRVVNGEAYDFAGNRGVDSVTVKLDKTDPAIDGAVVDGLLGRGGWYVGPVKVGFSCDDTLSGVATCADDVTLTENGAGQSVTGDATDKADNGASAQVTGIKIDREKPTVTNVNVDGQIYTLGDAPAASCRATDSFSGLDSCRVEVTGGNVNGAGTFQYTATATDVAGNVTTQSGTYRVIYRFGGFLQPINDTAHQVGVGTSVFKAGSTVPVKLQLRDAANNLVTTAGTPTWVSPVKGSAMSAPVDETAYATSPDSGLVYRLDAGSGQYHYNWKSGSTGGSYWRIGVRLDDGQTYFVNIGLR